MTLAPQQFGKYRVIREIGAGGMGMVYLGQHTLIGKEVAIKVLLAEHSADPEVVDRFFNEARASTHVKHPGVIDVFDFGKTPEGNAYIVMEHLEGETLSARLAREGRLSLELALQIARQIASALAAVHGAQVIHRDLKPDNIFLVSDPELEAGVRVKVLDFGIAKLVGELGSDSMKTRAGMMLGTPSYMSPEQIRDSSAVDHRSDIYALGCLLFAMVAGKPPFVGTLVNVVQAHINDPPPDTTALGLPPAVGGLIARCLAKDPVHRPSIGEIQTVLGDRRQPTPLPMLSPVTDPGGTGQAPAPPSPLSRGLVIGGVVVVTLAAAGLGVLHRSPKPTVRALEIREIPSPTPHLPTAALAPAPLDGGRPAEDASTIEIKIAPAPEEGPVEAPAVAPSSATGGSHGPAEPGQKNTRPRPHRPKSHEGRGELMDPFGR